MAPLEPVATLPGRVTMDEGGMQDASCTCPYDRGWVLHAHHCVILTYIYELGHPGEPGTGPGADR